MKNILFIIMIVLVGCTDHIDIDKEKEKLMQTDINFSNRSIEVGNHQAFLEYAASDAVLLKPNHMPIIGKVAIEQHFNLSSDSIYQLSWQPSFARVAESGELGYTFGFYQLEIIEGEEKGKIYKGTYTSIWEKNAKGNWRFVLDTGNSGLEEEQ